MNGIKKLWFVFNIATAAILATAQYDHDRVDSASYFFFTSFLSAMTEAGI